MSGKHTGSSKFGWCIDKLHDQCWGVIDREYGNLVCGCDCHKDG